MLGRSDGVLKPSGVRFGSSEIYNVLTKDFPSQIEHSLCVGRRRPDDTDETVVLFLKITPSFSFSDELRDSIKVAIRKQLSARHVPGIIVETPEIPFTANGKKRRQLLKALFLSTHLESGRVLQMRSA